MTEKSESKESLEEKALEIVGLWVEGHENPDEKYLWIGRKNLSPKELSKEMYIKTNLGQEYINSLVNLMEKFGYEDIKRLVVQ